MTRLGGFGFWILDFGLRLSVANRSYQAVSACPSEEVLRADATVRQRPWFRSAIQNPKSKIQNRQSAMEQGGFVLVCVLWILAILTVIAVGFQRRAVMDARAAVFTLDHTRAMFMARGAVARGIVELRNKAVIDEINKQPGRTSYSQKWAHTMDMLQEKGYYSLPEEDASEEICQYHMRDEESLICVNAADEETLRNVKPLSLSAVRKIMRRRNGDPDTKEPAQAFQTIEELREIAEIKDRDWFGTEKTAGLNDLVTCWGDGKININTAAPEVLECIPDVNRGIGSAIIGYRVGPDGKLFTEDDQDFKDFDDLAQKVGVSADSLSSLRQHCKVDSQFFTITGIATLRQGKVIASCVATVVIGGGNAGVIKWREEIVES